MGVKEVTHFCLDGALVNLTWIFLVVRTKVSVDISCTF